MINRSIAERIEAACQRHVVCVDGEHGLQRAYPASAYIRILFNEGDIPTKQLENECCACSAPLAEGTERLEDPLKGWQCRGVQVRVPVTLVHQADARRSFGRAGQQVRHRHQRHTKKEGVPIQVSKRQNNALPGICLNGRRWKCY